MTNKQLVDHCAEFYQFEMHYKTFLVKKVGGGGRVGHRVGELKKGGSTFTPTSTAFRKLDFQVYSVRIDRTRYYVHDLIFLTCNGYIPAYVEHKNGNFMDNRPMNLVAADSSEWYRKA